MDRYNTRGSLRSPKYGSLQPSVHGVTKKKYTRLCVAKIFRLIPFKA